MVKPHTKACLGVGMVIDLEKLRDEVYDADEDFPRVAKRIYVHRGAFDFDGSVPPNVGDISHNMSLQLEKINPKFRELTDLLCFSDRTDLDLKDYKRLLRENYEVHFRYLWDRFRRATEIFWEDGEQFWSNRLSFFLSLNEKSLSKHIEEFLEKRMFNMARMAHSFDVKFDTEYLQFVEFCKVKFKRRENLDTVKIYLTEMSNYMPADKLIRIVNSFIPMVFKDINEYVGIISKKITQSARHFDLLLAIERQGIYFDKEPIVKLAFDLIVERAHSEKNRRAFFTIINDPSIRAGLKRLYNQSHRAKLISFLNDCDYLVIEDHHLRNIRNVIDLDSSVGDELAVIYAGKLYQRNTGHKRANADRLIRLLHTFPQIAPKKVLAYLSSKNKISDIKYVLSAFPELRKLAAFV